MKYCGYCGNPNDSGNVRCVNCGSFFDDVQMIQQPAQAQPNVQSPVQMQPITPSGKNSAIKNAIIYIILIIISVLIVAGGLYIYNFTSYRKPINYFEIYFNKYEPSKIVDMYSEAAFYESGDQDTNYKSLDNEADKKIRAIYDYFGDEVGNVENLKIKFKVTKDYRMSDEEYNDFMDNIDYPNKAKTINDARIAEIKITASLDNKSASKTVKLIITLEKDDEWKIYSFDEV